ncbi:MAG: fructose-6-phosphate aldolase [Tissierellia bacterium]|nr:fructose-6-phosphate aldolase [Tissierellia bacterium]
MKLFIDTANIDEIKEINEWGVLDGVTTNPSLIAKSGGVFEDVILEIASIVDGPISAEVIGMTCDKMVSEAKSLAAIHENIIVKIPMTEEGLKAVKILSNEGIKTNVTLVFSVSQGLLAARAGATYVSPFIGRLDDIGEVGMELIWSLAIIFHQFGYETEIIAASIRNTKHVEEAAESGAHIATIPYKIFKKMLHHDLTTKGLKQFLEDFKNVKTKGVF